MSGLWLDVILFIVVLVSGTSALYRGLCIEILSILSLSVSLLITYLLYKPFGEIIGYAVTSNSAAKILSIFLIFIISFILLTIMSVKISDYFRVNQVNPLNRYLGLLFGVIRGFLIVAMGVFLLSNIVNAQDKKVWLISSKSYPMLYSTGQTIYNSIPSNFLNLDNNLSS